MDLCNGKEFDKDTRSKISRLIECCENQIKEFNGKIEQDNLNDNKKKLDTMKEPLKNNIHLISEQISKLHLL